MIDDYHCKHMTRPSLSLSLYIQCMHVYDVMQTCDPVVGMWLHITAINVCSKLLDYLFVTDDGAL